MQLSIRTGATSGKILGKCYMCGESTSLDIHRECHRRKMTTNKLHKKPRRMRKEAEDFLVELDK